MMTSDLERTASPRLVTWMRSLFEEEIPDLHRFGWPKEVGKAGGRRGEFFGAQPVKLRRVALVQDHDLPLLPREGSVEQFPREHQRRARKNEEDNLEFTALRLVDGERVGEFEAGIALLTEIGIVELEDLARLGGKLDFQIVRIPIPALRAPMTHDHANLAVGEIPARLGFGIDAFLPHRPVAVVDYLVAVNDLRLTHRLGDIAKPARIAGLVDLLPFVADVDQSVERIHAPWFLADRAEDLPCLGLFP